MLSIFLSNPFFCRILDVDSTIRFCMTLTLIVASLALVLVWHLWVPFFIASSLVLDPVSRKPDSDEPDSDEVSLRLERGWAERPPSFVPM